MPKLQQLKIIHFFWLFFPLLLSDFDDFGHLLTYLSRLCNFFFSARHFSSIFSWNFIHFLFCFYLLCAFFFLDNMTLRVADSIDISHFSSDSFFFVFYFRWNLPLLFSLSLLFFIGIDEIMYSASGCKCVSALKKKSQICQMDRKMSRQRQIKKKLRDNTYSEWDEIKVREMPRCKHSISRSHAKCVMLWRLPVTMTVKIIGTRHTPQFNTLNAIAWRFERKQKKRYANKTGRGDKGKAQTGVSCHTGPCACTNTQCHSLMIWRFYANSHNLTIAFPVRTPARSLSLSRSLSHTL